MSRVSRPTVPGGSESAVFGYAHKAFSSIFLTNSYLSLGGYKQMTMTGLLNLDVEKAEAKVFPAKINFRRTNRRCVRKDRISFLP